MSRTTPEEHQLIARTLEHCAAGTTDMREEVYAHPVSNYASPERLAREIDTLFRDFPIVVAHCSELPSVGDFITHTDTGVPILVTRNREGHVRAFINVCRHRGMRVAQAESGHSLSFTCAYHSWTYDLDGRLKGMPHPDGFASIDRARFALVELPACEQFGLIWVRPRPSDAPVDFEGWLAPMVEQMGSLNLAEHHLFRTWAIETKMNWRIALEGFQESYHFCSAHKESACSTYLDNQSVWLDKYPHYRQGVPLPRVARLAEVDPEDWDYRPNFMGQSYLFPCNFLQVMTDHVYVHSIFPTGVGTCVFKCMMLTPEAPASEKAERYFDANYQVVRRVFGEDFEIGEQIQLGLGSGANNHFLFGRSEYGLHLGRRAIDDAVEGRLRCPLLAP